MGRYDRIRIFDGTNWRKPRKIFVYNGTNWVNLKADDDTSQSGTLHVFDSVWKDATKHYVTTSQTHYSDWYTTGQFNLADAGYTTSNFCYCPNANGGYDHTWELSCTVRKTVDADKLLFYLGSSSESTKIKILWLADGRIKVETRFNSGTTRTLYSSNSVGSATGFVPLTVYQAAGSNTMHIHFNGQETTGQMYGAFSISNPISKIGDSNINFQYNFHLEGGAGSSAGHASFDRDATELTSNNSRDSWTEYSGYWE